MSLQPERPWDEESGKTPGGSNGGKWGLGCLGIVAAIIAMSVLSSTGDGDSGASDVEYEQMSARLGCHDFIERELKAPSTADYSGEETTGAYVTFTTTGAVDAENSFGAKIRANFVCIVESTDHDTWRLVSLSGIN